MSTHQHILERYMNERVPGRTAVVGMAAIYEMAHIETDNGSVVDLRWEMATDEQQDEALAAWLNGFRHDNLYMDLGDKKFRFGRNVDIQKVDEIPQGAVILPPYYVGLPIVMSPEGKVIYIGKDGLKNAEEKKNFYDPIADTQDLGAALDVTHGPKIS